uniref:Dimer_Tnp_hAT domain-containing protein n=1 Tax=Heterorhabditis bacteriophora TaxID=37862 RepID=A0A1I7WD75_HETBA
MLINSEILENLQLSPISERSTAQGLVDTFGSKHHDAYSRLKLRVIHWLRVLMAINYRFKGNFNESMSSHREEMTVIFVRLRNSIDINLMDSPNVSMDMTPPTINSEPLTPYVDITDIDNEYANDLLKFLEY